MNDIVFKSQTYGKVKFTDLPLKIESYYDKMKQYDSVIKVIIGTDSQNFSYTKIVNVIALVCAGHGGIFFYRVSNKPLIKDIRKKLHEETNESLELAMELTRLIEECNSELFNNLHFSIHVDAGKTDRSKTKELIPELVGWIQSCGYDCEVKPNSYAASSIADKLSK